MFDKMMGVKLVSGVFTKDAGKKLMKVRKTYFYLMFVYIFISHLGNKLISKDSTEKVVKTW